MKRCFAAFIIWVIMGALLLPVEAAQESQSSVLPSVIEVVGRVGVDLSPARLSFFCKRHHIPVSTIYQWKNHLVIYATFSQQNIIVRQIKALYPKSDVKCYSRPFYIFNRESCKDASVAKAWNNILLTTNLVKDTTLQKEYMQYHATQFEKWPEVSTGFCNASFQQLLVFRDGRQLILVISIPKGASLDELNPKTTENNPRVNEWNRIMAKYQEGLPGTVQGEVWVFLKQIEK